MDSTFISAAVQNMWNTWNIRVFMILSLCMQLVLALTAPFRPKTSNGLFIIVVWSAYLLADWGTLFAFGLISNSAAQRNSNNSGEVAPSEDVMAFWAAFLLIYMGGPDAITAFSLEDNALWLRHLVELIAQLFVFLYIFVKTLPHNTLLAPTTLIFVAGVIKYGERTRGLYLASLENLKKSIKKTRIVDSLLYYGNLYEISKGLIVDITPDLLERNKIREEFLTKLHSPPLIMIGMQLGMLYEVLYTKIKGANSEWGMFARGIAYFSTLAAFILFCLADKQEFHGVDIAITYALLGGVFILHVANLLMLSTSYHSHQELSNWKKLILWVFGQGFLPFLLVFALYTVTSFLVRGSVIQNFLDRDWSEKMGSFNVLSHCFKQGATTQCQKPGKLKVVFSYSAAQIARVLAYLIDSCTIAGFMWNKLAEMRHTSRTCFDSKLFDLVLEDLQSKTKDIFDKETMRKVYEARRDWVRSRPKWKPYINAFEYDKTLFIWHVATEICYNIEGDIGDADKTRFSKVLSDYMMYLLVKQPKLMSPVAGITHIRYEDTCVELKLLRRKFSVPNMKSFCTKILDEHPDNAKPPTDEEHAHITEPTDEEHADINEPTDEILKEHVDITIAPTDEEHADINESTDKILEEHVDIAKSTDKGHDCAHSVLKDSCRMVQLLRKEKKMWEVIFYVWVELLSYAAGHCRADSHARLLSEGGEFITFVWVWMAYFGVGAKFPIE